jgi:hypothetical protein
LGGIGRNKALIGAQDTVNRNRFTPLPFLACAADMYGARSSTTTFVLSTANGCRTEQQARRIARSRSRVFSRSRLTRTCVLKDGRDRRSFSRIPGFQSATPLQPRLSAYLIDATCPMGANARSMHEPMACHFERKQNILQSATLSEAIYVGCQGPGSATLSSKEAWAGDNALE